MPEVVVFVLTELFILRLDSVGWFIMVKIVHAKLPQSSAISFSWQSLQANNFVISIVVSIVFLFLTDVLWREYSSRNLSKLVKSGRGNPKGWNAAGIVHQYTHHYITAGISFYLFFIAAHISGWVEDSGGCVGGSLSCPASPTANLTR